MAKCRGRCLPTRAASKGANIRLPQFEGECLSTPRVPAAPAKPNVTYSHDSVAARSSAAMSFTTRDPSPANRSLYSDSAPRLRSSFRMSPPNAATIFDHSLSGIAFWSRREWKALCRASRVRCCASTRPFFKPRDHPSRLCLQELVDDDLTVLPPTRRRSHRGRSAVGTAPACAPYPASSPQGRRRSRRRAP